MANVRHHEPVFNVPAPVTAMVGVLVAVHLVRQALSENDENWLVLALAFIPDRYGSAPLPWPGGVVSSWMSPLTYMLIHGDWVHLGVNALSLMAFGGILARRLGAVRFLVFTILTGLAGALVFALANPNLAVPMMGASGATAGMMAGALRLLFSAVDHLPNSQIFDAISKFPQRIPLKPLSSVLTDRRLLSATGIWLAVNMLGAFGLGTPGQSGPIAWEAHVGGYLAGLLCLNWLDRPAEPHVIPTETRDPAEGRA
jgi:membrane associated rhomboid family serine protease